MDTTSLKQIVARHFDYSPHGTGQFFHGEWFTPKHKDSLAYLLEEITAEYEEEISVLQKEVDAGDDVISDLKAEIRELEKENVEA